MNAQALLLLGLFAFTGYSLYVPRLLGIDPKEKEYFQSTRIMCKDGSKTFPRDRLNDNFCDCADGTDEPGAISIGWLMVVFLLATVRFFK